MAETLGQPLPVREAAAPGRRSGYTDPTKHAQRIKAQRNLQAAVVGTATLFGKGDA